VFNNPDELARDPHVLEIVGMVLRQNPRVLYVESLAGLCVSMQESIIGVQDSETLALLHKAYRIVLAEASGEPIVVRMTRFFRAEVARLRGLGEDIATIKATNNTLKHFETQPMNGIKIRMAERMAWRHCFVWAVMAQEAQDGTRFVPKRRIREMFPRRPPKRPRRGRAGGGGDLPF
jgi:hypothetical protein